MHNNGLKLGAGRAEFLVQTGYSIIVGIDELIACLDFDKRSRQYKKLIEVQKLVEELTGFKEVE